MNAILAPLDTISRQDKLRALEELWDSLAADEQALASPSWHESVLQETEARYRAGAEVPVDWEAAKAALRAGR